MILLCGIASEPPLARVADELRELDAGFVLFHQRRWADCDVAVHVRDGTVSGRLRLGALEIALEDVRSVYTRLMDDRLLPELVGSTAGDPARARCRALHEALARWIEISPARVINRAGAQLSNSSKPYQAQLIQSCGLAVPETLITSDPDAALGFRARHGRVVFKSISGVRSIVREFEDADIRRLDAIRWCPVQFQERVPGVDVRVHVVADAVFATRVASQATDYRYAERQVGAAATLEAFALDDDLAQRCRGVTAALGLELSGIDLRLTPAGEAYCFEVNPSPAFSYYEGATGQPIAAAIARHLASA